MLELEERGHSSTSERLSHNILSQAVFSENILCHTLMGCVYFALNKRTELLRMGGKIPTLSRPVPPQKANA